MFACLSSCFGSCFSGENEVANQDIDNPSPDGATDFKCASALTDSVMPDVRVSRLIGQSSPLSNTVPNQKFRQPRLSLVLQTCATAGPLPVAGIRQSFAELSDEEIISPKSLSPGLTIRPRINSNLSKRLKSTLLISTGQPDPEEPIKETENETRLRTYSDDPFAPPTPGFISQRYSQSPKSATLSKFTSPTESPLKYISHSRSTSNLLSIQSLPRTQTIPTCTREPLPQSPTRERLSSLPRLDSLDLSTNWNMAEVFHGCSSL
ncbi:hypothetical protein CROQUDRAFT_388783 [Cronartium quercuum f. sp. fusiforme G11]|uniref:Uncharacterized protein n=1 Tax=Cronartium quercuum f. sp. fusiforme G11 TaxID=708437 RepID=A0A9P6N605_9BASI|nr:hypothetical protein CROQUDRAFT_388783 [Cronartium quercuum f. sp. fusiforme G11]